MLKNTSMKNRMFHDVCLKVKSLGNIQLVSPTYNGAVLKAFQHMYT